MIEHSFSLLKYSHAGTTPWTIPQVSDRFSLLIAAVCHDVGHPGRNNPFLVEANDPLALKYNDKSPLENMHAAIMFEVGFTNPGTALFRNCAKNVYMSMRKVAIEAILHTDMVHHFAMVSELKLMLEENYDLIKLAHEEYWTQIESGAVVSASGKTNWEMPWEVVEFWKNDQKTATMRQLVLHAADISNPFKPFPICRAWAYLVGKKKII